MAAVKPVSATVVWIALGFAAGCLLAGSGQYAQAKTCLKGNLLSLYSACKNDAATAGSKPESNPSAERFSLLRRPGPAPSSERIGNVELHQRQSYGKTGMPAVFLQLKSETASDSRPVRLVLRCLDNNTNILFQFAGRHMSDLREKSELFYSIDGSDQQILELSLASDEGDSVMGVWHGHRAIPFIKTLIGGSMLEFDAWDRENNHFRVGFEIASLEKAVQPLRETCGW